MIGDDGDPVDGAAVKLDDLPLSVLNAMADAVVNPASQDMDREALRARGAGLYVMRGDGEFAPEDAPTDTVEVDDKLLPGDRPIYLRFRVAS